MLTKDRLEFDKHPDGRLMPLMVKWPDTSLPPEPARAQGQKDE